MDTGTGVDEQLMLSSINGVDNVYTQHTTLLAQTLEGLAKGKLNEKHFPAVGKDVGGRPTEVLVFVVGGATFEEATAVTTFNSANPGMRVILGCSCIHNSTSFTKELAKSFA